MSYPYSFASDNFSSVHPEVMDAIQKANNGHAMAYGGDPWTEKMRSVFKNIFGPDAEAFIVFNGTAANVSALNHLNASWKAVVLSDKAHVLTDECGASQASIGCSFLPIVTQDAKINPEMMKPYLLARGFQHHVQPYSIHVTQSTELGSLYSLEELKAIGQFAKENEFLFFMDGARICNAAAALNTSLKSLTTDVGVDVLSFGGTKNGLMGVEVVVFLKPGLSKNFEYVRKQQMQLASKMRYLSAQFVALLEGDLWLRNAKHANAMAKLLEEKIIKNLPQVQILQPVQTNSLFVKLPAEVLKRFRQKHFFWVWDVEQTMARWMTSWDTKPEYIDEFLSDLSKEY